MDSIAKFFGETPEQTAARHARRVAEQEREQKEALERKEQRRIEALALAERKQKIAAEMSRIKIYTCYAGDGDVSRLVAEAMVDGYTEILGIAMPSHGHYRTDVIARRPA